GPLLLAVGPVQTDEPALGPEGEHVAAGDGRRGPRAGAAEPLLEPRVPTGRPHFLPRRRLVADDDLAVPPLLDRDQEAVGEWQRCVPATDRLFPNQFGRRLFPIARELRAGRHAVAVGSAIAGPVAGLDRQVGEDAGRSLFLSVSFQNGIGTSTEEH